ncbi:MAG: cadherin domain-containing protein, partial [Pseudomonadota bacterium]
MSSGSSSCPATAVDDIVPVTGTLFADEGAGDVDGNVLDNDISLPGIAFSVVDVGGGPVNEPVSGSNGGTFTIASDGTLDFDAGGDFVSLADGETALTSVTYSIGFEGPPAAADIMILQDITGTMAGELPAIREQLPAVIETVSGITDAAFGLATFADKPFSGFGPPDGSVFDPRVPITDDLGSLSTPIAELSTLPDVGSPDGGQLEALLQLAVRAERDDVNYRTGVERFAVVITDSAFHEEGDFDFNDDGPVPDNDGDTEIEVEDFPSIAATAAALAAAGITPVFAVPADLVPTYRALVDAFGFGQVVQIADDGSDLIEQLPAAFLNVPGTSTATVSAVVTGLDDVPVFVGPDTFAVAENETAVGAVEAIDPDGAVVFYSIVGGADAALFTIDALSGEIAFIDAPDFEAPADADGDNRYEIVVEADDETLTAETLVTVDVGDVAENLPPVIDAVTVSDPRGEGDEITLTVLASDVDLPVGEQLRFAFDTDGDGVFETVNETGVVTLTFEDNGPQFVPVLVTDDLGAVAEGGAEFSVANVAPTLIVADGLQTDADGNVTLTGRFIDPGLADTFTLTIDWGDGSDPDVVALPANPSGSGRFAVDHTYTAPPPPSGRFEVDIALTDDDGGEDRVARNVVVDTNEAPTVQLRGVRPIEEAGTAVLRGTVRDGDPGDLLTLRIDWGDAGFGSIERVTLGEDRSFRLTHVYRDDPDGDANRFTISATVIDEAGARGFDETTVLVRNAAPTFGSEVGTNVPEGEAVTRGERVSLGGTFDDSGGRDTYTVTIDWDDGTVVNSELDPEAFDRFVARSGGGRFGASHEYEEGGIYQVRTTLEDSDGGRQVARERLVVSGIRLDERQGDLEVIASEEGATAIVFPAALQ